MRCSLASIAIAIVLIANRDSVLFKLDIIHSVILMHYHAPGKLYTRS